jgi:hypothetical protein
MKNLRYVGGDSIRELSPSDLEQLGVEDAEATLTFRKGTSTTVDDKVADILLDRIPNLRESTDEELKREERDLEAELGFEPYNPGEHTVAEVNSVLAAASDERRRYILDQERAGSNRKTVFQSVGEEWQEQSEAPTEGEEVSQDDVMAVHEATLGVDSATSEAMTEAGGGPATSSGTGGPSGTASTSGGGGGGTTGAGGDANTSTSTT